MAGRDETRGARDELNFLVREILTWGPLHDTASAAESVLLALGPSVPQHQLLHTSHRPNSSS